MVPSTLVTPPTEKEVGDGTAEGAKVKAAAAASSSRVSITGGDRTQLQGAREAPLLTWSRYVLQSYGKRRPN